DDGPLLDEAPGNEDRRRVAEVVGVGLERQAPEAHVHVGQTPADRAAYLFDHAFLLGGVDVDDTGEQFEVVPRGARDVQERGDVLRKARTPIARTRVQELESDTRVVAHADRDLARVGVDRLTQVRNRVDERDLR